MLRSRSLEYRESAAKACIERVCSGSGAAEPVRYLRRAVELIADTGSHVQVGFGLPVLGERGAGQVGAIACT